MSTQPDQNNEQMPSQDEKLLSLEIETSVLIRARLRAHMTGLRCSDYCKGKILTALIKLENRGQAEGTLRNSSFNLNIARAER